MKTRYVVAFLAILIGTSCLAQNKTLGVGVATPNNNAALHVESPTSNQGFIMPRLTTAQRTAMAGLPLTAADDGLMVYDKDIKKIYIWDGATWQLAAGLNLPFASSTASASPALDITNTGTSNAGLFRISNAANSNPALNSITDGTGVALALNVTNASNSAAALSIVHGGTGNAISANRPIQATQFIGDGSLLTGLPSVSLPFTGTSGAAFTAFEVTHTGANNMAGDFRIQNPSSTSTALRALSDGNGAAFTAANVGINGFAVSLENTEPTNSSPTAFITNAGIAPAAVFNQSNALNSTPVLSISSSGSGPSIFASGTIEAAQFVGDGSALSGVTIPDVTITAAGENVSIGKGAGTSTQGVTIGDQVGGGGNGNVFIGKSAGSANTGNTNTFIGWNAGASNTDGLSNIFIGPGAGGGVTSGVTQTTGDNTILIGLHADIGTDGLNDGVAIGNGAVVNGNSSVAIGTGALVSANNSIVLGNTNAKVGIGVNSPTAKLEVISTSPTGHGADIRINEVTSNNNALNVYNEGLGYTAYFRNGNASATGNALLAENYGLNPTVRSLAYGSGDASLFSVIGTGTGKAGVFSISNSGNSSAVLESTTNGTGSAGEFSITNGSSGAIALDASTNGTGPAIHALHSNNGIAIDITGGTLKYSTFTTAGTTITQRAGVYNLTGAGSYSLPTAGVVDGEVCLTYNSTGGSINVEGVPVTAGQVRQFVRIASAWRLVN